MAGDWIKMRAELWTHPKFIALSNAMIYGDENGMLIYACGQDALGIGRMPPPNGSVTDRALSCVTKRALRDITMCALLRVWCSVNAHARVVEKDAVCSPMDLIDLDEIAGFDGFGEAMELVGWCRREDASDSVFFLNFLEHNEPACLRAPAKTNRQRQADWRARQREEKPVTERNESNGREEKRREDINTSAQKRGAGKTAIPENWQVGSSSVAWCQREFGLVPEAVERYRVAFIDACKAKDYRYKDFDSAFRNCVRQDWPRFRVNGESKVATPWAGAK